MSEEKPESKFVRMRVNASGYQGAPVSLMCAFDPATDVISVIKEMPEYESKRREGFLLVTTEKRDIAHDALFQEEETRDSITAFFSFEQSKLLVLASGMGRHNPSNAIEREGMDEAGMKFKIRPEITNGQFGVLMACYFANKQREVSTIDSMFDTLENLEGFDFRTI